MAAHGKLEQFHMGQEGWESYKECLQQYFVANDIAEADKQRAILLSACGQSTYKVLRNLVAPKKPGECAYKDILEHLRCYYSPKPLIIFSNASSILVIDSKEKVWPSLWQSSDKLLSLCLWQNPRRYAL